MARISREKLAIGHWVSPCCLHDLHRIETQDDLTDARDPDLFAGAWETVDEAVAELIQGCDQEEIDCAVKWYRGSGNNDELAACIQRYVVEPPR